MAAIAAIAATAVLFRTLPWWQRSGGNAGTLLVLLWSEEGLQSSPA